MPCVELVGAMALRLDDVTSGDVDIQRDRVLVERFQSGDVGAFDELYRRYLPRLVRFCEKRVGDRHEAEEVAQEAMARALRAMPAFAGERRFYPWVSVIASRLCVDSFRRRARSTPEAEIDLGYVDGGQDEIVAAVDTDLLRQALERLGPRHREVLHLREEEGWSYQRIADHYGVSMSTVEALLFRARKALRREFLAIAPRDGGFFAGVPLLGFLLRKAGSLRARFESWNAGTVLPVAANVTAAVAIGSVAVLAPSHHASGGATQVVTPAITSPANGFDAPAASTVVLDPAASPASSSATAATAPAATSNISAPAAAPAGPRRPGPAPASIGPASDSSNFATSAPVAADDGHVILGVDPAQLVTSTVTNTASWVNPIPGGH